MATQRKQIPKPAAGKKGSSTDKQRKQFRWGRLLLGAAVTAIIAMICAMGIYMLFIVNGNNILNANRNKLLNVDESSTIYDVNNKEVTSLKRGVNREVVEIKDIPVKVTDAFIATEDRRFHNHVGVDFYSLGRALVKDVIARSAVEGGSTITQQLAKNVFTNAEKTAFRKATEMSIAIAIENNFTKDEIMKFYLNRIYFGNGAYGIKAAAKLYFGVSDLNALDTWQIATLAAMPKAPSVYNPIQNPQKSKDRRAVVLQLMADQGYITEQERIKAATQEYAPRPITTVQDYAAFMDTVVEEAQDLYNISEDELFSSGYKIYTTLDTKAQQIAEQTYSQDKYFQKDAADGKKIQSSMAIVNNRDGGIVALTGARGYRTKDLNLATSNPRQPGSSFKPIAVYGPALESGKYSPYSILNDEKQTFAGYEPNNYDGAYRGKVGMQEAVAQSINLPAVWLLEQLGGPTIGMKFADKLGIKLDPQKDRNLAIALGGLSKGATPLQMATAYTAFANGGYWYQPHTIVKIIDGAGHEIATHKPQKNTAMSAKTAYYMTLMMQGVVQYGTGTSAKFDRPLAGKTGTTQLAIKGLEKYNRDVWMVGYTPEWTAAVWEGFLVTDEKHYVTVGSGGPSVIFKEVMSKALAGRQVTQFQKPADVPDPQQPPKAASELSASYDTAKSGVKLTWTSAGDNMQYQVYRKGSKDADFAKLIDSATTEVLDITVQKGETYQYYVTSLNTDNNMNSDRSNVASVTIAADATTLPPLPGEKPAVGGPNTDKNAGKGNPNSGNVGSKNGGTTPGTGTNGGAGAGAGNAANNGGAGQGTGTGTRGGGGAGAGSGKPNPAGDGGGLLPDVTGNPAPQSGAGPTKTP